MALTFYAEFPPCPALRPYVACLWAAKTDGAAPHRVLPDNCVDILWQDTGAGAFAVGMMSAPIWVPATGPVRIVAVRFRPGAASLFLGAPLRVLTDTRAELADLWGRADAMRLQDALWQPALTTAARLRLVEQALLARRVEAAPAPTLGQRAVAIIEASHGAVRLEALADALHVSRQHLALQFGQQVGLTPKLFARICRFRRASEALRHGGAIELAQLALDCGYFDQSHLIRDFHDFAGTTPATWRR
ncbi:AraC family transcriptional regulator [Pseudoduganella armeniaca]|uniref:AraC family transcriptional regulator n=1 Tax=Pseudoduganella armeniaca TaxID=2072590 RepID=A0A2R4C5Q4_9BURK|nr:helix-turn-helix domain-containing protein [Pseudoduganella armeniaca]AVR94933.1 AraC family transcriptional regulator [Pseudoduganella armeniaca]